MVQEASRLASQVRFKDEKVLVTFSIPMLQLDSPTKSRINLSVLEPNGKLLYGELFRKRYIFPTLSPKGKINKFGTC